AGGPRVRGACNLQHGSTAAVCRTARGAATGTGAVPAGTCTRVRGPVRRRCCSRSGGRSGRRITAPRVIEVPLSVPVVIVAVGASPQQGEALRGAFGVVGIGAELLFHTVRVAVAVRIGGLGRSDVSTERKDGGYKRR